MMIVDSSALLAIVFNAPEAPALLDALVDASQPRMSTANWLELAMLIEERGGRLASLRFDEFFRATGIELIAVDAAQASAARIAWRHFGRNRHSARLNFGDCFAYALAKETGEKLLFQGDDFARTDIVSALEPQIDAKQERSFF
jgi:ribonuclease VapC